ncbi:MAG TPA: hypothetical protein DCM71_14260 [Runella sp.]|nr:hypothetical protein [Runella sp.]
MYNGLYQLFIGTCPYEKNKKNYGIDFYGQHFDIYNLDTPDKSHDFEFNKQIKEVDPDGTIYYIISNKENPNFSYNYTDRYWQKLGLINVKNGDSYFIQVLFGPQWDKDLIFPTMDFSAYNDPKLNLLETTIINCNDKTGKNKMVFPPISLDAALQPIFVGSSFPYSNKTTLISYRPIYTKSNIVMDDCVDFVTENYQDTLGLSVEGAASYTKVFKNDLPENTIIKYFTIRNRLGGFYMEANQTGYIFTAPLTQNLEYLDSTYFYNSKTLGQFIRYLYEIPSTIKFTQVNVERVFSAHLNQLRTIAHNSGMAVMSAEIQKSDTIGAPQTAFSQLQPDPIFVVPPTEDSDNKIDFNGAFGIYAREMYFHAPMAIAKLLANQLQYDDVRKWYNYVVDLSSKDNTWKYYDFKLPQIINVTKIGDFKLLINGCNVFPFEHDSYYIANTPCICINLITNRIHVLCCVLDDIQKKISAYLVNASLVDNYASWEWTKEIYAISWDSYVGCYVESGIEFVEKNLNIYFFHPNSSTNKMLLSSNDDGVSWLSPKTVVKIPPTAQVQTIKIPNIAKRYVDSFDPDLIAENFLVIYQHWTITQYINFILDFADNEFRQETWESLSAALQLYFEAEDVLGEAPEIKDEQSDFDKDSANRTYTNKAAMPFGPPTNQTLKALWDRLNDRLYKLRNGLNINGDRQMPSMYGSAIDPARLLLAAQNGGINPYDNSSLKANRSVYRFREMAPHTESLINLVVEFGGQLYSALVQKDNEQLQVLQATHQINMLNVVAQTYQYQIDEAASEIAALKVNLDSVAHQKNYYDGLINKGVNTLESKALGHLTGAKVAQIVASNLRTRAFAAHFIPTIYGLADGGFQPGSAIDSAATVANEIGQALQTTSQILNTTSEYIRRAEEWHFQSEQAQYSIDQINASLASATLRLNIAQENLKQYNLQVSQANEVYNYLKNKFTSADLYNWMSGQMASLYFTAYQLANTALHTLQEAYQYELDEENDNFIPSNAWNSLKKGLLAGETLKLALLRMHDAYLTKNKRRQEVERIISLKDLMNKKAAASFDTEIAKKEPAELKFNIDLESLGKKDVSSIVKIKSIAVSIPAVVGPYETFGAVLKHTHTKEEITISRGIEDMGVFIDEMNDGRYLPFEGLKIEKGNTEEEKQKNAWTLKFPETKDKNISDVILNIKFTVK